ncbi:DUF3997 domain-containing protein [Faecalimicrobium dakarense]|uniref:DUF3997 domain-containing protein n=1 Tax=Faecalimicrobium dakarense TaxID=1301100 RepID=UPI0004B55D63|nr:DUF3997 domain-containing protein [[Clostridium] dakarense]
MKKATSIITIALVMITMVGCAGAKDYEINLINGYHVVRTSANNIKILKKDKEDTTGNAPTIPVYNENKDNLESVVSVGQDDRFILAKTNKELYYILDTHIEILYKSLIKAKFEEVKEGLGISKDIELKNLDSYEKIR